MIKKLTGLTASVVALASIVNAEVKINDNLAVSGYAVGASTLTDPDSGGTTSTSFDSGTTNFDAVKVALTGTYDAISGKASLFYVPESTSGASEAGLLDAYLTYTAGSVAVTGGKFLSYLGYEAWDAINMTTITYGNSWNPIPGYHTGAKIDYTGEGFSLGAAIVDSLYMDTAQHFFGGDGSFTEGLGYEFVATYTGVEKLTVFTGLGIEDPDTAFGSTWVFDIWASYALTDKLSIAGEYSYVDNPTYSAGSTLDYWAVFSTYTFSDKIAATGRVSGTISDEYGTQFTFAPTYTINSNFSVRGEVTYSDSTNSSVQVGSKGFFYAVQGIFKF